MASSTKMCSHTEGPGHDCAYVEKRNALISLAEAAANVEVGATPPEGMVAHDAWCRRWDAAFHRMMERLTADLFIRSAFERRMVLS